MFMRHGAYGVAGGVGRRCHGGPVIRVLGVGFMRETVRFCPNAASRRERMEPNCVQYNQRKPRKAVRWRIAPSVSVQNETNVGKERAVERVQTMAEICGAREAA